MLHSVSLIHFAAHGNTERGEIALSPVGPPNRIPEEEDYLLTMSDIALFNCELNWWYLVAVIVHLGKLEPKESLGLLEPS